MQVDIINMNNEKVGTIDLPDAIFGVEERPHLVHEAVRHFLNSGRRGTAKVKTRAEVRGSGRKPWRQKGTGRARVGSVRSPLWRHGGVVHGPQPRSYGYAFPKKARRQAMCSALSAKANAGKIKVIDEFQLSQPKTRALAAVLSTLGVKNALLVDRVPPVPVKLASQNLQNFKMVSSDGMNIYEVLKFDHLLCSQAALEQITERLSK